MSKKTRKGTVPFEPRARLLKIIGEELISDEVVAMTELVKNAHDADASIVTIEFRGDARMGEGEILISDDGHGMSLSVLLKNWMQPAGSSKRGAERRRSRRGRRMLGEKGVGRFAADKLGAHLEVISRAEGSAREIVAHFDWDRYSDENASLSDIRNEYEERKPETLDRPGTILRISRLRTRWSERLFRRLVTRLARLQSPFLGDHSFRITVDSDEFPDYSGNTGQDRLDASPHRVEASFDGDQHISIRLASAGRASKVRWPGPGQLRCGPVQMRIHAFDLETDALAQIGPVSDVRSWLKQWTGISVYRDGFRIWPYGEPNDDWLRLDQRRVNNPVVRLSNNQVVGFIEITRDRNPDLEDKTNREGLQNNEAFEDLRRLVIHVLEYLEDRRQEKRHPRTRHQNLGSLMGEITCDASTWKRLRDITGHLNGSRKEARNLIGAAERQLQDVRDQSEKVVRSMVDLAANGLALSSMSFELGEDLTALRDDVEGMLHTLVKRKERVTPGDLREILARVEGLREDVDLMAETGRKRRRRTVDLVDELERLRAYYTPAILEMNAAGRIDCRCESRTGLALRVDVNAHDLRRVLHLLIRNSLDALAETKKVPRINLRAWVDTGGSGDCIVEVSDSGPGIPPELHERVFEPLFTTRKDHRGLGLFVAHRLVQASRGSIEVIDDRRGLGGARIRLTMPRKSSRAT